MGDRRKGREYALQALYLMDVAHMPAENAINSVLKGEKISPKLREFAEQLTLGTEKNLDPINEAIKKYADNWEISRMAAIDRNILRLSAFELMFDSETPISVIIDEAVEIAKHFSTPDSGKFVNGILDKIKFERPAGKAEGE